MKKKRNYPIKHRWWLYSPDKQRVYTGFSCCGLQNYQSPEGSGENRFDIGRPNHSVSCKNCLKCRRCYNKRNKK